jgi:hypothetical protein
LRTPARIVHEALVMTRKKLLDQEERMR